jgi:hypothetical protein
MTWRTPIVAYEEKGHRVAIFSTPPCVFTVVDGIELGPFYQNMEAARKAVTKHINELMKEKKRG